MAGKVGYPAIKPDDIFHQFTHLDLDQARLFAHFDIHQDGADGIKGRHQGRGRDDPDLQAIAFFNDMGIIGVKFGVNRLRRQKHQRRIGGFTKYDVAFGNIAHMFQNVGAERLTGTVFFNPIAGIAQPVKAFQWKFGINHYRPRRVGQVDQAIGNPFVR